MNKQRRGYAALLIGVCMVLSGCAGGGEAASAVKATPAPRAVIPTLTPSTRAMIATAGRTYLSPSPTYANRGAVLAHSTATRVVATGRTISFPLMVRRTIGAATMLYAVTQGREAVDTVGHALAVRPAAVVAPAFAKNTPVHRPTPEEPTPRNALHLKSHHALPALPVPRFPLSWMSAQPILTIYGRGFGIAPILGQLGSDSSLDDMAQQVQPYVAGITANDGARPPVVAIHLIYALATPCSPGSNCLLYLDDTGVDIVKDYIIPAAKRHWLVVLDDQLSESNPVAEVQRLIAKGYLQYDNVEIALDPEFRAVPGQDTPGIPVGTVDGAEINAAGAIVNAYCAHRHMAHGKILMFYQFQTGMITNRQTLRNDYPYVAAVDVADGFGQPATKVSVYQALFGPGSDPGPIWRGIKLFYPNSYEQAGHGDYPVMTWPQVFGKATTDDGAGHIYRIQPQPNIIIIA